MGPQNESMRHLIFLLAGLLLGQTNAEERMKQAMEKFQRSGMLAQQGKFDRALELYAQALPLHPNPQAILTNIEALRRRKEAARTVTPGDRDAALDRNVRSRTKEIP